MDKRFAMIGVGVLVLAQLVAGCAPAPTAVPEATAPKVLKVGVLVPLTGTEARIGQEFEGVVTMAFEDIDYKIGDYEVELVWMDDENDPEKATRAYEEAVVRDGIDVGILNWDSSVSSALMEITAKHKIPHFFGFGATGLINEKYESDPEKYGYWMGKTWPSPDKLILGYVEALEEVFQDGTWTPKAKRAGLVADDTEWGRAISAAFETYLEEVGWEIVVKEYFHIGETDFYPILTKMKAADISLLAGTVCSPVAVGPFAKQVRELELNCLVANDGLGWMGEWYDLCGEASDYMIDMIPQFPPEAQAFRDEFEERWGIKLGASAGGLAYDAVRMFIKLAQATYEQYGELTSETLYKFGQEQLWTGKFTYTDGMMMKEYKYVPETVPDPIVGGDYFIFPVIQYFGGEGTIVWPSEMKEADLQIPAWAQ